MTKKAREENKQAGVEGLNPLPKPIFKTRYLSDQAAAGIPNIQAGKPDDSPYYVCSQCGWDSRQENLVTLVTFPDGSYSCPNCGKDIIVADSSKPRIGYMGDVGGIGGDPNTV